MLRVSLNLRRLTLLATASVLVAACNASGGEDVDATPAPAIPITIMPIGDSSTQGATGWSTYRCYLDAMLRDAEVSFDFVGTRSEPRGGEPYGCPTSFDQDFEGSWGAAIHHLVDDVTANVQTLQPDIALIHLGGNDLGANEEPVAVAQELQSFITGLQAVSPDISVLVAQIYPCNMPLPKCTEGPSAFNEAVGSFANLSTAQSDVVVVDLATGFDPDHFRDATHITDAGDEFVAGRWMAALQETGLVEAGR